MTSKKASAQPKRTGLNYFLYQNSFIAFILFFGLALWAFWTSYYGKLHHDMAWSMRFHGMTMTAWCLIMIWQPLLIRLRKNNLHKVTGKLSYLLVPLIVISGAQLAHITCLGNEPGTSKYYYFIALMFNSLIAFAVLYGLAMWNRKKPLTHARYMVCTILPLFTPITDRIIYKYVRELVPLVPMLDGMPMVQTIGFALADILLFGLLIWDWRAHKRLDVFPVALFVLVLYQVSVLAFYNLEVWRWIGDGIMRLPLS